MADIGAFLKSILTDPAVSSSLRAWGRFLAPERSGGGIAGMLDEYSRAQQEREARQERQRKQQQLVDFAKSVGVDPNAVELLGPAALPKEEFKGGYWWRTNPLTGHVEKMDVPGYTPTTAGKSPWIYDRSRGVMINRDTQQVMPLEGLPAPKTPAGESGVELRTLENRVNNLLAKYNSMDPGLQKGQGGKTLLDQIKVAISRLPATYQQRYLDMLRGLQTSTQPAGTVPMDEGWSVTGPGLGP